MTTDNPNTPETDTTMSPRFELAIAAACAAFAHSYNNSVMPDHPLPSVAPTGDAPEPAPKAKTTKAAPVTTKAPEPEPDPEPEVIVTHPTNDDTLAAMKRAIASGSAASDAAEAVIFSYGVKKRSDIPPESRAELIEKLDAIAANPPKASALD